MINVDYQTYLKWMAEKNPMPAINVDEPTIQPMILQDTGLTTQDYISLVKIVTETASYGIIDG